MTDPLFAILSPVFLALAGAYIFIVGKYTAGWRALPEWNVPPGFSPGTKISIVVPARNEEKNIAECLSSIADCNYPRHLCEIWVVDDHSTDRTPAVVRDFSKNNPSVRLIRLADFPQNKNKGAFKKWAIETAIAQATGELIVTTDADCTVPQDWLLLLGSFYEKKRPQFMAAPVVFHRERSVFERFQSLDFLGMMGVTGAGLHLGWMNMCNGANLAYTKKAFEAVGGFAGIDHLASGDDMLLMQKMAAHFPKGIVFLKNKNAAVSTLAKPGLASFTAQRLRWATKSASYKERWVTAVLALVFFYCWAILFSVAALFFLGAEWAVLSAVLLALKSATDYFFLQNMAAYFGRADLMKYFWPSQCLHIAYIAGVGLAANFKKSYRWKGRKTV